MKAIPVTALGIDVPMMHLPDCAGPKVGVFEGNRGDWLARCNKCSERRVVTPHEMAEIRHQLAARHIAAPTPVTRSNWRCREHPDQPVTPTGKGCQLCAGERRDRDRKTNRNERTPA